MKITRKTNIGDALENSETAAEILFNAGVGCIGCAFANSETIEQGLSAHGLTDEEIDKILEEMNK